ncbi:histidine phosphatase family protein [Facklamia lactis]|uniref:histidine phosphatase family protein n=1 Tax=Facklamia lactis TaxID=2749967 RepID=UPI0018CED57E|nr:histidine phosphatase family protein [Facklamia lactis]MBG9980048.1 histidine phosphatase family protein [Facklamia lactis]
MQFVIVKSGLTLLNENHQIQGSYDLPLSEKGKELVFQYSNRLELYQPTFIVTSMQRRSRETAEILINRNGWQEVEWFRDSRFNDRHFGFWEGKKVDDFLEFSKESIIQHIPGGEYHLNFLERIHKAMWSIQEKVIREHSVIVMVLDERVIKEILNFLNNESSNGLNDHIVEFFY